MMDRQGNLIPVSEDEVAVARQLTPLLLPHLERVSDAFYARVRSMPNVLAKFTGGEAQLARQRDLLEAWLREFLAFEDGPDVVTKHQRIGRVHVRAGVDERLVVAGISWIREELLALLSDIDAPDEVDVCAVERTISRLLDISLTHMLSSYWSDLHEKLQRADRLALVGRFTATINHELRNPLGVVKTSTFLIRQHLAPEIDETVEKHLDRIARHLERAERIMASMRDLVSVRAARRESVNLRELVDQVIDDFTDDLSDIRVLGDDACVAAVDRTMMYQLIENLLRNASEAADGLATVEITWEESASGVTLIVADDGPGIPPEMREKVLEPLFTTKSFGSGLGLTMIGAVVDCHRGTFEITDGLEGRGAGFRIFLPND